jgi:signal peptidase I
LSGVVRTPRSRGFRFVRDVVIVVVLALVASFLIRSYVVRSFFIPSASMQNTLLVGDRVIVYELVPGVMPLQRGDVVVFQDPGGWLTATEGNDLIKRVIGLPGDHVSCCDAAGHLTVNGHAVDEPYAVVQPGQTAVSGPFDVTVPAGHIWVMGDNRYNSADSRVHGPVPESDIVGRAVVITWPVSRWSWLSRHGESWDGVPNN